MTADEIDRDAPQSGRRRTLVLALQALHERAPGGLIVEVGTSRNPNRSAMLADGWATRVFAWYAEQTGGSVISIDNNPRAIQSAMRICGRYADRVRFVRARAELVVGGLEPDLLYMDGPSDAAVHLAVYHALRHTPRLVLWDDIILPGETGPKWPPRGRHAPYAVKGELAIPAMLDDGWTLLWAEGRQVLMEAPR